jgi:predicted transcriptional regulator
MKELTKAEEQVMQVLWTLGKAFVKDIVEKMPNQPAYNTVSTIVRILETKGFIDHKAYGKTHEYFPVVSRQIYTQFYLNNMVKGYFNGSITSLVSFFAKENSLKTHELEELMKKLEEIRKRGDEGTKGRK